MDQLLMIACRHRRRRTRQLQSHASTITKDFNRYESVVGCSSLPVVLCRLWPLAHS